MCAPASGSSDARAVIRREIGHTIDTERLRLVYQPIVALSQRTIVGYEALLRWRTPDGTEVATEEFVAVAESLGFIEQIGRWALDQAIGQLSRFDRDGRDATDHGGQSIRSAVRGPPTR